MTGFFFMKNILRFAKEKQRHMSKSTVIVVSSALATVVLIITIVSVAAYYFVDFRTGIRLATAGYAAGLAGNTDLAIENLNQALRHTLTKYQRSFVFLNRGAANNAKWRFDEAIRDQSEALRLNPTLTDAHIGRGFAYQRKGEREKAVIDFSEAIRLDPNSAAAYYNRGTVLLQNSEPERALPDFEEAVRCNPQSVEPLVMRGLCYLAQNNLDRALANFDGAIATDSTNAMGYMERANLYFRKGEYEKGDRDREYARRLNPGIEQASNNFAVTLSQKLWATTASSFWKENAGKGYLAVFQEAKQAAEAGNVDRAIQLYNVVLVMDITSPQASLALMNRANLYHAKGEIERASLDYDQALRLDPNNAGAYVDRALILSEKGKHAAAMKDYEAAIEINPGQWEAYFNRAISFRQNGDVKQAIEDLTTVIRLNTNFANGYVNRANVYIQIREWSRALNDCDTAIRIDPNVAEAYFNRAKVYAHFGDRQKELHDLETATSLNPKKFKALLNDLAWQRATSPDKEIRNGPQAVAAATKACEMSDWKEWTYLDTLAAAHAEAGNFDQAIKYQKEGLLLAKAEPKLLAEARQRLSLYEQHKPYRENAKH
jgi:tetratricopeptide (TPR) repeat protein